MITGIDYALLFPTYDSAATGLLGALYGGAAPAATASPLTALQTAERDAAKQIAATAKQPAVARDIAAFRTAVAAAKSPADLLGNPTVLRVLLTANGLADQADMTALAQKTLLSNANDSNALVNRLADPRWKPVVQTYDFANKGLAVIANPQTLDTIANAYAEITWRQSLDATTPGLSNALSFRAQAASVGSVDQILGDPVLRDVVTVALGIPQQIAFQDLPAQEQAISSRLDIARLKDAHFVDTLTQQYLLNKANTGEAGAASLDQLAARAAGLVV